jgi:4,5:9,10-diseco-3-hydroxy-5,9,17-trioxoandrosta-1(10),2-diene-4-oate hydrolase
MAQEMSRKTHNVTGGYDISIAEMGAGPVVIFIHGSGPGASGTSNFRHNAQAFVDAGYRVILPDLVGYGQSSKPEGIDYPLELFTQTLLEALARHGVTGGSLVGNSLGGGIALQIALDHPEFTVDRLILMAPGCVAEQASYFTLPGIAKMRSSFGSADFNLDEQRALIGTLMHPDSLHRITDALVEERFAVARTQSKDVIGRMKTPDLGPRLGEIACPIFVLWGLNDEFCPEHHARLFLDACRDVRCLTFARTGHWVQVERAEEFNRYSVDFLNGQ